jgi:hypothetical protein
MRVARGAVQMITHLLKVGRAVSFSVNHTHAGVMVTDRQTASLTAKHLVRRQNGVRLERAGRAILLADQSARAIGPS